MNTTRSAITGMSPQFLVPNLDDSLAFYTQKLGFQVEFRYEDFYAGLTKDGFQFT